MNAQRVRRLIDPRLVDVALIAGCLALTAMAVKTPWASSPWPLNLASGLVGSFALGFRRRRPIAVALIGAGTMALSGNPGPLLVGVLSATAGPARRYPVLAAIGVAGIVAPEWIDEGLSLDPVLSAGVGTALLLAVGAYARTRRQLVATLRERADRAEAESVARDERARAGERTRIAREMHDVLAHKVSLISLHAGALEVNATAEPHRIEQGATVIRATAQEALEELRAILGVLRVEPGSGAGTCDPDPGPFPDLGRLVASWNEAGADVTLRDETAGVAAVPARTIYRLVQEGLTNAHRHAPGSAVTVTVTGTAAEGVRVTVVNGPAPEPVAAQAGSGVGLVGLAERFRLVGGTLSSGDDGVGGWRLEGWLPLGQRRNRP